MEGGRVESCLLCPSLAFLKDRVGNVVIQGLFSLLPSAGGVLWPVPGRHPPSSPSTFVRTNWTKLVQLFGDDECLSCGVQFPIVRGLLPPPPPPPLPDHISSSGFCVAFPDTERLFRVSRARKKGES